MTKSSEHSGIGSCRRIADFKTCLAKQNYSATIQLYRCSVFEYVLCVSNSLRLKKNIMQKRKYCLQLLSRRPDSQKQQSQGKNRNKQEPDLEQDQAHEGTLLLMTGQVKEKMGG